VGRRDRRQGKHRRAANIFGVIYYQDKIPIEIDSASRVVFDDIRMLPGIYKANASAVLTQSVHLHVCAANRTIAVIYKFDVGQREFRLLSRIVCFIFCLPFYNIF